MKTKVKQSQIPSDHRSHRYRSGVLWIWMWTGAAEWCKGIGMVWSDCIVFSVHVHGDIR